MTDAVTDEGLVELIEFVRAEAAHYDKTIYKDTVRKFNAVADALEGHTALLREIEVLREALAKIERMTNLGLMKHASEARNIARAALSRPLDEI